jgi:hypothetical protein
VSLQKLFYFLAEKLKCGKRGSAGAENGAAKFNFEVIPEAVSLFGLENLSVRQIPVFRYGLLMRYQGYIEFEKLEKQCWSYLWKRLCVKRLSVKICLNIGVLPKTGIFFSKTVASGLPKKERQVVFDA